MLKARGFRQNRSIVYPTIYTWLWFSVVKIETDMVKKELVDWSHHCLQIFSTFNFFSYYPEDLAYLMVIILSLIDQSLILKLSYVSGFLTLSDAVFHFTSL